MTSPRVTPFRPTARDRVLDYAADQDAATQRGKEILMGKWKTKLGERLDRFPDVSNRGERIAEVRELMAEAFEKAEQAVALKQRMTNTNTADVQRFPILRGGQ